MSHQSAPDVTVVIPTRDRPELLRRAIATALAQESVAIEIVVIDDGSSPAAATAWLDPRVRVLPNTASRGVAAARNRGIFEARGQWIAFLDDDDLWSPIKLRDQLAAMALESASWSHTGTLCLTEDLGLRWTTAPMEAVISPAALRRANTVGTPSGVVASAELLRIVGGFDATFSTFADWDLWLRLVDLEKGIGLAEPLLGYVTHPGSMHRGRLLGTVQEMRMLERSHRHRGAVGGRDMWFWIADSRRDGGRVLSAAGLHLIAALRWRDPRSLRAAIGSIVDLVKPRSERAFVGGPVPVWVSRDAETLTEAPA